PSTGLLEDALSKGLGAIASLPLGVRLLATLWERAGALPTDRVEVYRQGLEELLEKDPSPSHTLGVAQPLAWAVVATASAELRRGVAPDTVNLTKAERCFAALAGRDVAAAMRSPIFAPSNEGWRFVHRSFAEYLA
ncbi:MAG: hypothetical protein KC613_18805, partial [Myxococcales bacterium]|nr:hypothetical protein [Myxococcales bacterium]